VLCYDSSPGENVREEWRTLDASVRWEWWGDRFVTRALRNHNVWLTLTYLGLILLMARVYA
jgi:hypothetical protein